MQMWKWLAVAAFALSSLLTAAWLLLSGTKPRPTSAQSAPSIAIGPSAGAELRAVEHRLSALQAELASLKSNPEPARAADAVAEQAATAATATTPPPPSPTTPEELHARLDFAFANEPIDVAWARTEERAIHDFVGQADPSATIEELQCRSEMCRIKLRFETESAVGDFRSKLGLPPLDNGGFYHIEDARFTYFAPRKGRSLPLAALD